MPFTFLKIFIFDFLIEGKYFLTNVRESLFYFPLQNLSFIKYLGGKWGTFWAFRYKSMAYFNKVEVAIARFTSTAAR